MDVVGLETYVFPDTVAANTVALIGGCLTGKLVRGFLATANFSAVRRLQERYISRRPFERADGVVVYKQETPCPAGEEAEETVRKYCRVSLATLPPLTLRQHYRVHNPGNTLEALASAVLQRKCIESMVSA